MSSVGLPCHQSHHDHVLDPSFDGLARSAEISRVLTPKGTESSFHGVAGGNAGEAHSVAFSVTFPMGAVFARTVQARAKTCRKQACRQAFRADGASDKPLQPLAVGDGLVRNGRIPERLRLLIAKNLTCGPGG